MTDTERLFKLRIFLNDFRVFLLIFQLTDSLSVISEFFCEGLPVTCADPAACQVGGSLVSTSNLTLLHGYPGTFSKIFIPGHSQRDHPQLRRGQGQHHRGVDASKCHVRRGRLPGELFTKCPSIVVVKAEEAYNGYLDLL